MWTVWQNVQVLLAADVPFWVYGQAAVLHSDKHTHASLLNKLANLAVHRLPTETVTPCSSLKCHLSDAASMRFDVLAQRS